MSGTGPREAILYATPQANTDSSPTRMNLTNTKTRLKGAQTGHSLLAKKRDALTLKFRAILKKVDEVSCYYCCIGSFLVASNLCTRGGSAPPPDSKVVSKRGFVGNWAARASTQRPCENAQAGGRKPITKHMSGTLSHQLLSSCLTPRIAADYKVQTRIKHP